MIHDHTSDVPRPSPGDLLFFGVEVDVGVVEVLVGDVGLGDLVVGVVAFGGDGLDFADELGGF